jgi:two-component system, chemotaxis family, response regulator Rcp1
MHEISGNLVCQVLLVEDNPADARLTQEALREGNNQNKLHHVKDGVEALQFMRREGAYADAPTPDVVILDLNMPRKDGRQVLAEMKQDPKLRLIPAVVLTTSEAEADIQQSYELNANCYITKPVDLDKFINIVRTIEAFWLAIVKLPNRRPDRPNPRPSVA